MMSGECLGPWVSCLKIYFGYSDLYLDTCRESRRNCGRNDENLPEQSKSEHGTSQGRHMQIHGCPWTGKKKTASFTTSLWCPPVHNDHPGMSY